MRNHKAIILLGVDYQQNMKFQELFSVIEVFVTLVLMFLVLLLSYCVLIHLIFDKVVLVKI